MNAQELTLNIAVNLGRIARFAQEKKQVRLLFFLKETQEYLQQLESASKSERFLKTFFAFKKRFNQFRLAVNWNEELIDEVATWATILIHRAKLA